MPSPANIREQVNFFGFNKQTDISTTNADAGIWRLNKLNAQLLSSKLNIEDDATEYGKGHEFATVTIPTSWDSGLPQLEKYLSAEFAAWSMVFGLGHSVKTGSGSNHIYTCTPLDLVSDGIELPYFSFGQAIRQGGSSLLDRIAIGCVVEGWTLTVGSGPGRANSKLVVDLAGSGKFTDPSGVTIPAATTEKLLPSASLAATINGVDYVSAKNIVSLEATWKNNIRINEGFFPGSNFQTTNDPTTGAIRGRLECGDRQLTLKFVARFEHGSDELSKLTAQTTGTAVISLSYDANNSLALTFQKVAFAMTTLGDTNGIVTVEVICTPLYHSSNGLLTAVAKCNIDTIGEATP
jgi:hypothetical protein